MGVSFFDEFGNAVGRDAEDEFGTAVGRDAERMMLNRSRVVLRSTVAGKSTRTSCQDAINEKFINEKRTSAFSKC